MNLISIRPVLALMVARRRRLSLHSGDWSSVSRDATVTFALPGTAQVETSQTQTQSHASTATGH